MSSSLNGWIEHGPPCSLSTDDDITGNRMLVLTLARLMDSRGVDMQYASILTSKCPTGAIPL